MFFKEQEDPEIPSFSQDIFIRRYPDNLGWRGKQGITFSVEEAAMELWEFPFLWAALPKSQKSSGECAPLGILSFLEGKNPPKHKGNLGMS